MSSPVFPGRWGIAVLAAKHTREGSVSISMCTCKEQALEARRAQDERKDPSPTESFLNHAPH